MGAILIVSAGTFARKGLSTVFGEIRETPGVIRKSVFNIVRHPIYLSEIMLYLGFIMLSMSIAATVVWIIGFLFLHFIASYEEKLLLNLFGEEYERYMQEVPMWFPRFLKR
jgi:protein-S-isoprenylcysteine O-methyltransferase Ste14